MYEIFEQLLQRNGVTAYKISQDTGIGQSTLSAWKMGKSNLKADKLQILADYFGVTVDYLMNGDRTQEIDSYYLNPETRQIAQEIFDNKDMRVLFDIARNTAPERLKTYAEFLKTLHDQDTNN